MSVFGWHAGCLMVVAVLTLSSSVHANSDIWSNEVAHILYGRLDSNITLVCPGCKNGAEVEWRVNGSVLVGPRDRILSLLNTDPTMEGNYSCYDANKTLLHTVYLRLGRVPSLLAVSCWMVNHFFVHCSWHQSVVTHLPTQYIVLVRDREGNVEPCHQEPHKPNRCTLENPTIWQDFHIMNITEVNPLGTETTLVRLELSKLLKPDAPEAVTAEEVHGQPRRLRVRWKYPGSWPVETAELFPLSFQLRYRPLGSNIWSTVHTSNVTLMITDALLGHFHQIQVQARDSLNYGHWSDWSSPLLAKSWTVPHNPKELDPSPTDYKFFTDVPDLGSTDYSFLTPPPANPVSRYESLGVLLSLGLFAGLILSMLLAMVVILWVRQRRRGDIPKQQLASMMKMKSMQI